MLDPTGHRLPRSVTHKILLVRALASKPRLLLLEDPWMNFENKLRLQIMQLLTEMKYTTLVVVSNDDDFARRCDRVVILEEGQVIVQPNKKN
jgi:ABC-type bacteriocin/lantibiotic exporter with double-glycine peptidase domain